MSKDKDFLCWRTKRGRRIGNPIPVKALSVPKAADEAVKTLIQAGITGIDPFTIDVEEQAPRPLSHAPGVLNRRSYFTGRAPHRSPHSNMKKDIVIYGKSKYHIVHGNSETEIRDMLSHVDPKAANARCVRHTNDDGTYTWEFINPAPVGP